MKKKFSILIALVMAVSLLLTPAVALAEDGPVGLDVIITGTAPEMEFISPLVVAPGDPNSTIVGKVDLVFDFYDADDDLVELEIDFGPDPYGDHTPTAGPDNREQMKFQAIPGEEEHPDVLALMASVGMFVDYDAAEQKWTISIDTTATQTQQLIDLGFVPWAENVGDPIWPTGLFHWYLEVVDSEGNLWGDMMSPPADSHYVCYFEDAVVAINLDKTNIDFGAIVKGETGQGGLIVVTNVGNVPADVTATVNAFNAGNVFYNLLLNVAPVSDYGVTLAVSGSSNPGVTLPVPSDHTSIGPESAVLLFLATATP